MHKNSESFQNDYFSSHIKMGLSQVERSFMYLFIREIDNEDRSILLSVNATNIL